MYNDYTQSAVSFAIQILVERIFLPFGYYFSTNWMRMRERILTSLPLDLTVKQSGARWGSFCHRRRKDASAFRFYRRLFEPPRVYLPTYLSTFFATCKPLHGLIVDETAPRKTSKLNGDGGGGSDWPYAQINSRLDICTWWCCVIIWSRTLLPGLLPLAQLPTSFLPMHKKTISQTLIRARPTSPSYRTEGFFILAHYEYRILNRSCVGSRCTSYVAFLSVAFDVDWIYLDGTRLLAKSIKFTILFYMFKSDTL